MWRDSNIHILALQDREQIRRVPLATGFPRGSSASYDEGCVASDVSHELERTGFIVKLIDHVAVEFIEGRDEILNGLVCGERCLPRSVFGSDIGHFVFENELCYLLEAVGVF